MHLIIKRYKFYLINSFYLIMQIEQGDKIEGELSLSKKHFSTVKKNDHTLDSLSKLFNCSDSKNQTCKSLLKEFSFFLNSNCNKNEIKKYAENQNENSISLENHTSDCLSTNHPDQKENKIIYACCKNCVKNFSTRNRACMCQVPKNDMRNKELLLLGCNVCGCKGCHPRDRLNGENVESNIYLLSDEYEYENKESKKAKNNIVVKKSKYKFQKISKEHKKRTTIYSQLESYQSSEYFINVRKDLVQCFKEFFNPEILSIGILYPKRFDSYILGCDPHKYK